IKAWEREFDGFVAKGEAPGPPLLRLPPDHTGSFAEANDGVNTVETELADNDYAVGLLVEQETASPSASDPLIGMIEDYDQDGPHGRLLDPRDGRPGLQPRGPPRHRRLQRRVMARAEGCGRLPDQTR